MSHIPIFSSRVTAVVSVTMVLLLIGIGAAVGIASNKIAKQMKDNLGMVAVFDEATGMDQANAFANKYKTSAWASKIEVISPDQVLQRWQQETGDDENIVELAGINPFSPELHINVSEKYNNADSLLSLAHKLELAPEINEVKVMDEMVRNVDSTMSSLLITLAAIAVVLLLVSIVLIFNTVRLMIYSRRFGIYTMKLVGATAGFIRRPFLVSGIINGLISGALASGALMLLISYLKTMSSETLNLVTWMDLWLITAGLIILGIIICLFSALCATNKYLKQKRDDLYK